MKRTFIFIPLFAVTFFLTGCPVFFDDCDDPCDNDWCGNDWSCSTHYDCYAGEYCDNGWCVVSSFCDWDGRCPEGFVCDSSWTCIPESSRDDDDIEERERCFDNTHCEEGYCDEGDDVSGFCENTGVCETDEDCADVSAGLICDDRGICVPEEEPCPSGDCGCASDSECNDGMICLDSLCTNPETVCFFDFECGEAGQCLNNECHATCTSECPAGQTCADGLCIEPAVGSDGCVYSEDCGDGFICINASCLPTCSSDDACADGEACQSGACRADSAPVQECGAELGNCAGGLSCHRGICRLPCAADINCTGEMNICNTDGGFCIHADELAPECTRAADCADGEACLSNSCVVL